MDFPTTASLIAAITADAEVYVFSIAFIFTGLVFFLIYFLIKKQLQQFLSFSILSVASGLNLVRLTPTHQVFLGSYEIFGVHIGTLALYLVPVGLLAFIEETHQFRPVYKKIVKTQWMVFLTHALLMALLDILGIFDIGTTNRFFTPLFMMTILASLFYRTEKPNKPLLESTLIKVGVIFSGLFGAVHAFNMMHQNQIIGRPIFHYGMFVLIVCFMLSLMQSFKTAHTLLKDQSEELLVKNSALNKACQEVDELNRSLELRVQERTEQLTCVNEELQAINEDLNNTMIKLVETQAQLIQSEKLSALGTLVAGIAHEINTPIAAIQSNLQLEDVLFTCLDERDPDTLRNYMQNVPTLRSDSLLATKRISSIIHDMKSFARLDEAEYKDANLNEGIESTLTLLNYKLINKRITVNKDLGSIPEIFCVPKQINQLILILLENAIDATPEAGIISISSGTNEGFITLAIKDTDCGISQANLKKIFDPGFTTKGVGVGTGLGLPIAFKIVAQHHGTIDVDSIEGKGSTFRIQIPIQQAIDITA